MDENTRETFEKLKLLGSKLDSSLLSLEAQFKDMVSMLTLPPSEEEIGQANAILSSLIFFWKDQCQEIEGAIVNIDESYDQIKQHLDEAEMNLKVCTERKDKYVKYATEKLNIQLEQSQMPTTQGDDGSYESCRPGLNKFPTPEADFTFLLPRTPRVLELSPGDDNTDNTVMEFK